MTRYLLDTNHAGTLLRDANAPLWSRLRTLTRADCALCRPVVGELWYMVFNSSRVDANRMKLEALLAQFDVWEFDAAAAAEFGKTRAELRRAGRPIPMFDPDRRHRTFQRSRPGHGRRPFRRSAGPYH